MSASFPFSCNTCGRLLAGAATGGLEAIHLRFALPADAAAGGLSVLLFAGTIAATALSAGDTFLLDKLLKGWKPNHFIEGPLRQFLKDS
jgi:hypothetical protein